MTDSPASKALHAVGLDDGSLDAVALIRALVDLDAEAATMVLGAYAGANAEGLILALSTVAAQLLNDWHNGDRAAIHARLDELTAAGVAAAAGGTTT